MLVLRYMNRYCRMWEKGNVFRLWEYSLYFKVLQINLIIPPLSCLFLFYLMHIFLFVKRDLHDFYFLSYIFLTLMKIYISLVVEIWSTWRKYFDKRSMVNTSAITEEPLYSLHLNYSNRFKSSLFGMTE